MIPPTCPPSTSIPPFDRFFTHEHIRAQAAKGKVLCKGCGFFFGEAGHVGVLFL